MKKIEKMQKHNYWKKRKQNNNFIFHFKKIIYSLKEKISDKNTDVLSFWNVLKKTIPNILFATILVAVTYFLDHYIGNKQILEFTISKEISVLIDISIAFIGFNGVFLAIYFSSTASIFTSKYANISEKVKNRFFVESIKYSNLLIYNVLILSAFVISLGCGLVFTLLVPILVGIMTLITLFSFYKLGSIAFSLSDINLLSNIGYKKIYYYIKKASRSDLFNVAEFQDYYKRRVKDEIDFLNIIVSYQAEKNNSEKSIELAKKNIFLIGYYQKIKHQIPNDSRWFDIKGECPYWFTADESAKMIALNTGTSLHYKEMLDEFWFEKAVIAVNHKAINYNLTRTFSYDKYLSILGEMISASISFDNINFWIEEIEKDWKNYIFQYIQHNLKSSLNVVVEWTGMVINIVLGINKKLDSFSTEGFNSIVNQLLTNPKNGTKVLSKIVKSEEINNLIVSLNNEIEIEGKVLTPKWYIAEILSFVFRQNLNNVNIFCDKLYHLYLESCSDLSNKGIENKELLAIASLSNKEIKQKLSSTFKLLMEIDSTIKSYHNDSYFKELDYDYENQINQKVDIHQDNLKSYCAIIDLYKSNYNKSVDSPDYIGYAYNNLIYDAFNSLLSSNNAEIFISHIKLLMENASIIETELKKSISNYTPSDSTLQLENSVRLSIMDIAGYFLYYNYLIDNNENIKQITDYLDDFFIKNSDYKTEITKYVFAYKFNTEINHITHPNAIEFTNRKLIFQSFIKKNSLIKIKTKNYFIEEIDHANKYIKAFPYEDSMGFFADFYEFFGICYLNRFLKPESKLTTNNKWEDQINE